MHTRHYTKLALLVASLLLLATPLSAFASITSDTSAIGFSSSGTSKSIGYPMGSGSNGILIVATLCNAGDHIDTTATTFSGSAMTFALKENVRQTLWEYIFYEYSPPSGTHNIVVNTDGTTCEIDIGAASYFGVAQSGFPDASQVQGGVSNSSLTMSLTTIADNDWAFMSGGPNNGPCSAGTNATKIQDDLPSGDLCIFDNSGHGAVTPPGSFSMTYSASGATLIGGIMVAFAPVGAVVATPKSIIGLVQAWWAF
jgi:hypothetical protein